MFNSIDFGSSVGSKCQSKLFRKQWGRVLNMIRKASLRDIREGLTRGNVRFEDNLIDLVYEDGRNRCNLSDKDKRFFIELIRKLNTARDDSKRINYNIAASESITVIIGITTKAEEVKFTLGCRHSLGNEEYAMLMTSGILTINSNDANDMDIEVNWFNDFILNWGYGEQYYFNYRTGNFDLTKDEHDIVIKEEFDTL